MVIKTYIIRLHRFQKNKPRSLVGVVEEIGVKGRKAFTNYDELWDVLNPSKERKMPERIGTKRPKRERG